MARTELRYFTTHLHQARPGHVIHLGLGDYVVLAVKDSKNRSCVKLKIQRLSSALYDEGQPLWIMVAKPRYY